MIMKYLSTAVLSVLLLSACGGSDKKNTQATQKTPTTSTTPTATAEPAEVHNIQPEAIPQYIENFKAQLGRLKFTLDGKDQDMKFLEFFMDQNQIAVTYGNGAALLGFDFTNNQALPTITVLQGDTSDVNTLLSSPEKTFNGQNIEVKSDSNGDSIYSGSVVDAGGSGSYTISVTFNQALISGGSSKINIDGTKASITGDLGTNFYIQMQDLIQNNPEVDTLVLQNISGSVNDAINMHSGRLVRKAMLKTLMPSNGEAYSGGVDLYLTGYERIYEKGGKLGVHSWCCVDGKAANLLAKDHEAHGAQLTFVREMLGKELGPEFYYFTLNAAPFDGMHNMTDAEIQKYFMQPNP